MKNPPTAAEARIAEIFSSLQGEGTHLGERHLFIRFEECHIHCTYCDELDKGGRRMTQSEVLAEVDRLEAAEGPHGYISLTGGEPLLYQEFIRPLAQALKSKGFRIYLETNGILWP
ncbi:MAG: 7-carboxy-7-deazaguanine synthase QueE, partial [Candidatus Omnitrophica bacterium]|nr:7-carboxy-7-deazaguanine synthase QueE [Candidatus Omnitrophota bacterium]